MVDAARFSATKKAARATAAGESEPTIAALPQSPGLRGADTDLSAGMIAPA